MEHHSNIVPWQILCQDREAELAYVPVLDDGQLDLDALDALLARGPRSWSAVVHVSNVVGTINPVEEIVAPRARCRAPSVLIDGTQAVPQLPVDLRALDADFYAWTGHKAYGPTGIGVLHGRRELLEEMPPFIGGGHMIRTVGRQRVDVDRPAWKFEAGTSQIAEAIGLGAAVDWIRALGIERDPGARGGAGGRDARAAGSEVPGLVIHGPLGRVGSWRAGLVRRSTARTRTTSARSSGGAGRLRSRRPPLRAAADAPPGGERDDPRVVRGAQHARPTSSG